MCGVGSRLEGDRGWNHVVCGKVVQLTVVGEQRVQRRTYYVYILCLLLSTAVLKNTFVSVTEKDGAFVSKVELRHGDKHQH